MFKFTRIVANPASKLSTAACQLIRDEYKIDDGRSDSISLGNALYFQFYAHQTLDSVEIDGEMFNRYDSLDNGQGIYPARMDSPLLTQDGYFITSEEMGLPFIAGTKKELTVDAHRANENMPLKAFHLMAIRLHNKRMDEHGDFKLAKEEVIALTNRITLNETMVVTGLTEKQIFDEVVIKDAHMSLEWNFGFGRWAHAQMPESFNGQHIFTKGASKDVDLVALFEDEMARDLNLGVTTAMTKMDHVMGAKNILQRTFSRHSELGLPSIQELAAAYRKSLPLDIPQGCPIWPGVLLEAELTQGDGLGPLGARAVADAIAGSLRWAYPGQGIWHALWDGAPSSTVDIIKYSMPDS